MGIFTENNLFHLLFSRKMPALNLGMANPAAILPLVISSIRKNLWACHSKDAVSTNCRGALYRAFFSFFLAVRFFFFLALVFSLGCPFINFDQILRLGINELSGRHCIELYFFYFFSFWLSERSCFSLGIMENELNPSSLNPSIR